MEITKQMRQEAARLALKGMMAGALVVGGGMILSGTAHASDAKKPAAEEAKPKYTEVHDCAGKNVCKGLGGCKVTEEKLKKLAMKAGVPAEKAGKAHACAGLNECKGLGGCNVTKEKFAKLKKKLEEKKKHEGHNH